MQGAELEEVGPSINEETTTTVSAVRMVVQRYRYARLLVNETQVISVGEPSDLLLSNKDQSSSLSSAGVLVYISFAKSATEAKVTQAAKTILNLPILTLGAWGDGEDTKSILQLATNEFSKEPGTNSAVSSKLSLLVVPQANLTAKVKKLGKSIQYRDQTSKTHGEELFQHFVKTLETFLQDHAKSLVGQEQSGPRTRTMTSTNKPSQNMVDPSIPPSRLFHQDSTYGSFEEGCDGQVFPVTYANGELLTKSARKKLQKIYAAHVIRHAKYLENRAKHVVTTKDSREEASSDSIDPIDSSTQVEPESVHDPLPEPLLIPSIIQLVAGTFGKRQALEIQSDMGPFCHVVEIN